MAIYNSIRYNIIQYVYMHEFRRDALLPSVFRMVVLSQKRNNLFGSFFAPKPD